MKFKVGDYVTIRQWDDMEKQFGAYAHGTIKCPAGFTEEMRKFCGRRMMIESVGIINYALKDGDGWTYTEEMFEETYCPTRAKQEIHITVDGLKTIAVLKSGGKVITRAEAKCNPADTFNFETGAKLAFERLFGREGKKDEKTESGLKFKVGDECVYTGESWFEKGTKVRVVEYDGTPRMPYRVTNGKNLLWVDADELEPLPDHEEEKPKFVPHLVLITSNERMGNIGKPTKFKDLFGRPLFIGDTVIHYRADGKEFPETPIMEDEDGAFVFGIKVDCNGKTGKIGDGWKIIKKRGYDEVTDGEVVYKFAKYVKTEGKE